VKTLGLAAVFLAALLAAVALFSVFPRTSPTADTVSAGIPTHTPKPPTPRPTPVPRTWIDGLTTSRHGVATLTSCLDTNGDGEIDGADGADLDGLHIPLQDGKACVDPSRHRDFYAGDPSDAAGYRCDAARAPLLIVAIGSAGTDLFDTSAGESLGVLDIVNALQSRAAAAGIATTPILSDSAIAAADEPQTRMEQWLTRQVARRLDAMPCLRTVLLGHSHGGVTVTSIASALDDRFQGRIFGVLIDRTIALYDRGADEMPASTPLLNLFQLNEGWHGVAIDQPNVTNVDLSGERAPVAPSDGGGGLALVSHKTLDDASAVRQRVVDAVMLWLAAPPATPTP
jgi:hypothetical protein